MIILLLLDFLALRKRKKKREDKDGETDGVSADAETVCFYGSGLLLNVLLTVR